MRRSIGGALGTWTESLKGGGRLPPNPTAASDWPELAIHSGANGTSVVYAFLGDCTHPHLRGNGCGPEVWRSDDAGASFDKMWDAIAPGPLNSAFPPLSSYAAYTHAATIHPTDPDSLWYGGIRLYYSGEGGNNWSSAYGRGIHPDVHGLYVWEGDCQWAGCPAPAPPLPSVCAYAATDGGLYVGDGFNCWNGMLQGGLQVTQFQSITADPVAPVEFTFGGTQDNGVDAQTFGPTWHWWRGADNASTLVDPNDFFNPRVPHVGPKVDSNSPLYCHMLTSCPQHGSSGFSQSLDTTQPYAFLPPMELFPDAAGRFFLGGLNLWKRSWATNWDDITSHDADFPPTLLTFPDINPTNNPTNVLTAIGVAPSNGSRMYIGYYGGEVYRTDNATDVNPGWIRIDTGSPPLPDRPVTAIAVHPTMADRAFVAFSGFGTNSVFATDTAGGMWHTYDSNTGLFNQFAKRPVNALVVVPTSPPLMFAGTDDGVYRRPTAEIDSNPWSHASSHPNAAVYDLAVDANNNVYSGTHGRGVWRLASSHNVAFLQGFEALISASGFFSSGFSAQGFDATQECQLTLVAQDGAQCVTSATDADGAILTTNQWGHLVATKSGAYTQRPMAWACFNGVCAGGLAASQCPLGQVRVACGSSTATWSVPAVAELTGPASSQLVFAPAFVGGATSGSFTLRPTMQRAGGTSETLCSVGVPFTSSQTVQQVLNNAAAAVNGSSTCIAAGVTAIVTGTLVASGDEDSAPVPFRLHLTAPARTGLELLTVVDGSIHAKLGMESVGLPMRVPVTPRLLINGVAAGGALTISAGTALAACTVTLTTSNGESAASVRSRIRDAINTGSGPRCLRGLNPRDVVLPADGVLRFMATQALSIHNTDSGLSYTVNGDS